MNLLITSPLFSFLPKKKLSFWTVPFNLKKWGSRMANYKKSKVGEGALASVIATIASDYLPAAGLVREAKISTKKDKDELKEVMKSGKWTKSYKE